MRTVWVIAQREYKRYFSTPAAYMIAFMFLLILGLLFYATLVGGMVSQIPPGVDSVLGTLVFLLLFATPAVTMHLVAEEQRLGTIELLLTAPVKDWELVVGKWLGGFLFILTLIAVTLIYPIVLNQLIDPGIDQGPLISGYLGVILISASFAAIGVTVSSFFSNQIAAFFASLGVLLLLWVISAPLQSAGGGVSNELLSYFDLRRHFYPTLFVGIIDIRDIVYFISLIILALVIGSVTVETRRWR